MKLLVERKFAVTINYPMQWDNCDWDIDDNGNIIFFDTKEQAEKRVKELEEELGDFGGWFRIEYQDTIIRELVD